MSTLLYAKFGAEGYEALTEAGLMEAAKGMVVKTRNRLVMQLQLKDIAGPGSTSTDIFGKFEICSKDL